MAVMGFDGYVRIANPAYERLFGWSSEELAQQHFMALVHPDDLGRALASLQDVVEGASSASQEVRVRCRDGSYRCLAWSATSSREEELIYAVGRDMTPVTRAQEAIARQAALLDLAHDAVIVCDREGAIVYWNSGAEVTYGWTRDEALGCKTRELLWSKMNETPGWIEAKVLAEGSWEGELVHRRRDGEQIVVHSRWALERDDAGEPVRFLKINRDITPRKDAEAELVRQSAELARANVQLTRSNEDLRQFAYVVSHDLAEPLRVISGYAELLATGHGGALSPEAQDFAEKILSGATRLQALVADVLAYSSVGRAELRLQPVDMGQLVEEVLSGLSARVQETGANVLVAPLPTVVADPVQLGQVMQNLIANALTYTRPGTPPRVSIRATQTKGVWRFSVTDNGIGIAVDQRQRIFQMFERLHRQDHYPGTGIGLAISRRAVERHGGVIWVEDAAGDGSRFCFTIPNRPRE